VILSGGLEAVFRPPLRLTLPSGPLSPYTLRKYGAGGGDLAQRGRVEIGTITAPMCSRLGFRS
jgi:hypothetical protein